MMTVTDADTVRMMARCPRCKAATSIDVAACEASEFFYLTSVQGGGHEPHVRCSCGRGLHAWYTVRGTYKPSVKCTKRCLDALRPDCECSCAGRHHGEGWLR